MIRHVAHRTAVESVERQNVDLWIDAQGPWSLKALTPLGMAFLTQDEEITNEGVLTSGMASVETALELQTHFNLGLLGEGVHTLPMQVILEGAQGVLGLSISADYWIMPLNSDQTWVEREGVQPLLLASGQWFLLQEGDLLYHGEQGICLPSSVFNVMELPDYQEPTAIWWESPPHLEAGDRAMVNLCLRGPSSASELILVSDPHLQIDSPWLLNGQELRGQPGANGRYLVQLPSLGSGSHELQGTVLAFLPPDRDPVIIRACWRGVEAVLPIVIGRSWFDYDGMQRIQVDTDAALLLPSGRVRSGSGGHVLVEDEGLNVVLPLANPTAPFWVGTKVAESVLWSSKGIGADGEGFVLPIFLWDQGLSWRLVAKAGQVLLDATGQRQLFRGQFGSASLEIGPKGMVFASASPSPEQKDGWRWLETMELHKGTYHQGPWLWSLEIPRDASHLPSLGVQYRGERVGFRLTPGDVQLRLSYENWAWGARASTRTLWLETIQPHLRGELNPQGLSFQYRAGENKGVKLDWKVENTLEFRLEWAPWEAYLRTGFAADSEAGLRYKQAFSRGRWLSLTKAAIQAKNELLLMETGGHLGYVLAPCCTLYVGGTCSATMRRGPDRPLMDLRYEAGLLFHPLPQLLASLSWSTDKGWQVKGGIAIPIMSRRTDGDSE
jgi:hypothetical protein